MKTTTTLILLIFITGCASMPPVDPYLTNMAHYERDFEYCKTLSEEHANVDHSAGIGAGIGAGFGATIALLLGLDVGTWAALGAATGGARGAASGITSKQDIINDCLKEKGYQLLGV